MLKIVPVNVRNIATRLLFLACLAGTNPANAQAGFPVSEPLSNVTCQGGMATAFPCKDVDLLAYVPKTALGGFSNTTMNDIWGWTDPETGREYALVGMSNGTSFVDVTNPAAPVYLGRLPTASSNSLWRDIKTIGHWAYIVAEARNHGVQGFNLTRLRGLTGNPPQTFLPDVLYSGVSAAHNIVANPETGFLYSVGGNAGGETCGGGLHMIDARTPGTLTFAGCFAHAGTGIRGTGYTHDAQCVVYRGPDERYTGREVCFNANETVLSIADVTDKSAPFPIALTPYPLVAYAHQAWLSEDHRYLYLDDELDELRGLVSRTRTLVFDVQRLDAPVLVNQHLGETPAIDHNQYVRNGFLYQANYTAGLRILDARDPLNMREVAFFDGYPSVDSPTDFEGAWSVYPYFPSYTVVMTGISEGLFVLRPPSFVRESATSARVEDAPGVRLDGPFPHPVHGRATLHVHAQSGETVRVSVYDLLGREVAVVQDGPLVSPTLSLNTAGWVPGVYVLRVAAGSEAPLTRLLHVR